MDSIMRFATTMLTQTQVASPSQEMEQAQPTQATQSVQPTQPMQPIQPIKPAGLDLCRGALNFATEDFFGSSEAARKQTRLRIERAGAGAILIRADGSSTRAYCTDLKVLMAIKAKIVDGTDVDALVDIFANAYHYGYLQPLTDILDSHNNRLLIGEENAETTRALVDRLGQCGIRLLIHRRHGTFSMEEFTIGETDHALSSEAHSVLKTFTGLPPDLVASVLRPYQEQLSFDAALMTARTSVRQMLASSFFASVKELMKEKFENDVIGLSEINRLSFHSAVALLKVGTPSATMAAIIEKFGSDFFFKLQETGLLFLVGAESIQSMLLRGDLTIRDLQEIDDITSKQNSSSLVNNLLTSDFSSVSAVRAWIEQHKS